MANAGLNVLIPLRTHCTFTLYQPWNESVLGTGVGQATYHKECLQLKNTISLWIFHKTINVYINMYVCMYIFNLCIYTQNMKPILPHSDQQDLLLFGQSLTPLISLFHTKDRLYKKEKTLNIDTVHSTFCLHARKPNVILFQCTPIIQQPAWFDVDVWSTSVIIRRVRLVSLRSSETEFCSGDTAVHVLDVLKLRLKVIGCIVRARHKYLASTHNGQSLTSPLLVFILQSFQRNRFYFFFFFYLILFSIIVWNKQVTDRNKSERWQETLVSVEFSHFHSSEVGDWVSVTNFCMMGSRRSRPGWISFSGLVVSAIVLTVAMYTPSAATLWE